MKPANERDFRAFAEARWGALIRAGYLLTGDRGHAEDLAQSTLVSVYSSWSRVSQADNMDAYVHRILVNAHLRRVRRRRIREVYADTPPESGAADHSHDVERRLVLVQALATLPPRQRAVVVLRYWSDLTEAQTAAALGCSVGTVKSQTSKALAKLRSVPGMDLAATNSGSATF